MNFLTHNAADVNVVPPRGYPKACGWGITGKFSNLSRRNAPSSTRRLRRCLFLTTILLAGFALAPAYAQDPFASQPKPAAPRSVAVPTPTEKKLANGLRVLVVPQAGSGLVTVQMIVRTGGSADPAEKAGLADMTASLLTQGTKTRKATAIADSSEALGATLRAGAGWDASFVTLSGLKATLSDALPLFAEVIREPTFPKSELERLRAQTLDELNVSLGSPGTLARFAAARVTFGNGAYGKPLGGLPTTLKAITQPDLTGFWNRYYQPQNAALIVVGDVTTEEGITLAEKFFGDWKGTGTEAKVAPPTAPPYKRRLIVIDKPDAGQAAVMLTQPGIARSDAGYYTSEVANCVLGVGFSSRLNREIRIKRGLSYGAGSRLDARAGVGPFIASCQTKNESAAEVAGILVDELTRLADGDLPETELISRKAVLSGDFARSLETGGGLAGLVGELALFDLPLDTLNQYLPATQAVTAGQVKGFAGSQLAAKGVSLVIVGNAAKFLPALKARFAGEAIEVIPVKSLDLSRPELKKP